MKILRSPRLFLSYAREDAALAEKLKTKLTSAGFDVFIDSERILASENFVRRLTEMVRQSDGVIALITPFSAASEWCQAELHHAHAVGIRVVPIRLGPVPLVAPLELFQRDIHYVSVADEAAVEELPDRLVRQLAEIRARARRRFLARAAVAILGISAIVLGILAAVRQINRFHLSQEREAAVARLIQAARPLSRAELDSQAERLYGDPDFWAEALVLSRDTQASDATRLSAAMVATRLESRRNAGRWMVGNVDWTGERTRGGRLADVTFKDGQLTDLVFDDYSFAGVVWGAAASDSRPGLTLAKSVFRHSRFNFGWFSGTNAVDVDFVNCSFRGSTLDVTAFSLVRVRSEDGKGGQRVRELITDEVAVVENSVVLNRNVPPAPHVVDLGTPTAQVVFDKVVFVATHFRGWIRPEWFRDCDFRYCVFPAGFDLRKLEQGGSRVDGCYVGDEALD